MWVYCLALVSHCYKMLHIKFSGNFQRNWKDIFVLFKVIDCLKCPSREGNGHHFLDVLCTVSSFEKINNTLLWCFIFSPAAALPPPSQSPLHQPLTSQFQPLLGMLPFHFSGVGPCSHQSPPATSRSSSHVTTPRFLRHFLLLNSPSDYPPFPFLFTPLSCPKTSASSHAQTPLYGFSLLCTELCIFPPPTFRFCSNPRTSENRSYLEIGFLQQEVV